MSTGSAPRVVVLGGGSAGWITACLLHHEWAARGGRVTVVESPAIGIIGVGEGSTPQLKAFFDHLGIEEAEWMAACDATYKLGIRFTGWSEREGCESYFHPFPGPVDLHTEPGFVKNCALRRRGIDVPAHPDAWFLAAQLASSKRGPVPHANFPFPQSYGYHFDAHKLGAFLRDWAVPRGVVHRPLKVEEVELAQDGDIAALLCEGGERIEGDLFVDCSGFAAMLAQQKLGAQFLPFAENLFNDSAVVMPTPHTQPIVPQTESIAMSAGWRWSIPLTSRVGNGYVYSSRHISDDDAATELADALGVAADEAQPRFLKMKVGRLENSWVRNCLATGLSQGFIEPLEATALHIVIATALDFAKAYESAGFTDTHRDTFNQRIAARYEGIRDYIVAHYRMNQRGDTDYWRQNAANQTLSDNLKAMMTAWFTHGSIEEANAKAYGPAAPYAPMSWHALFAGYGTFPPPAKMQAPPPGLDVADREAARTLLAACALNFPEYAPV
ncbi:tryptophan halogenase family protein [Qipengyuania seohaensis]|uniref:tryptophan halogenase family protein n=1 Tax=Qipengyuania seohaensis TaxID=266951 RepID=UPI000C22CA08|nr:tryptophan halogenase family protein [Qipengyuania seohaensis]